MSFPLINPKPTFVDSVGVPLVNGTVEFTDPNVGGAKSTYPTAVDADQLTNANPDVITLNARGEAPQGLFLVDTETYRMELFNEAGVSQWAVNDVESPLSGLGTAGAGSIGILDAGGNYNATNVEDAFTELASTSSGEGASIIGLEDAGGDYTATNVEDAFAELASTSSGEGASIIGIEDAGGSLVATNVEDAFTEVLATIGVTKIKNTNESVSADTTLQVDDSLFGWNLTADKFYEIIGLIRYTQEIGDLKLSFLFSETPQATPAGIFYVATDATAVTESHYDTSPENLEAFTTMTDTQWVGLSVLGSFQANASTGGTVDLQWAQNTSDANNTTLAGGSYLTIRQID